MPQSQISRAETAPSYAGVGCYKDFFPRAMNRLENFRKPSDSPLDWNDLEKSVVKRCAQKAMQTGYNFFGVQFFGECYGGAGQYDKYGPSTNCVWLSGAYVGKHWANYVYMLTGTECMNFTKLTDSKRSRRYKYNNPSERPLCDTFPYESWLHTWYRFDGASGKAMANTCVEYDHCGTRQPGWFNGNLPDVKDGIQKGYVCFNDRGSCCQSWLTIDVRNCGSFFVYKLPQTKACYKAYCGDGKK